MFKVDVKNRIGGFWCIFEVHLKFVVLEIRLQKNIFLIESAVKMKRWRVLLPIIRLRSCLGFGLGLTIPCRKKQHVTVSVTRAWVDTLGS
jgi:hypothetical protein